MSLQDKAMLVTLSVSCWTARKQDKKVSAEVEAQHNARDAGRYNKLLIDKVHLDPLTSYAGQIRTYHYKMTLPWMDNGARMLPSKLFAEYSAEMRKMKQEYASMVSKFAQLYSSRLVQEARQRLGTMYDPDDYPDPSELYGKFDVEIDIMPVPDGADFRVDVSDVERGRIRQEIADRVAKRQAAAIKDAWVRIREAVGRVCARLTAKKVVVHDSLIDNLDDLSRLLPGLNVSDDPTMHTVCERIISGLLVNPQLLRNSATARGRVVAEAEAILALCPT
jgi:hypothetical protein